MTSCNIQDGLELECLEVARGLKNLTTTRYFALQEARLFYASAEGGTPQHVTLRLQTLHGQLPEEALPKRLLVSQPHLVRSCRCGKQ
jgi:hypothetical protein